MHGPQALKTTNRDDTENKVKPNREKGWSRGDKVGVIFIKEKCAAEEEIEYGKNPSYKDQGWNILGTASSEMEQCL